MVDILVRRLSSSNDRIPVMVSERLIDVTEDYRNRCIMVTGQFRSYNRHEEQRNRLVLSVFAREIEFVEEEPDQIISCSKDICVSGRYIGRRRSEGKSRTCCWQSTGRMESQITSRASAGAGTRDMRRVLKWVSMSGYWDASRAGNM